MAPGSALVRASTYLGRGLSSSVMYELSNNVSSTAQTAQVHLIRISAKRRNVLLHPLQAQPAVFEAVVARDFGL